MASGFYNSAGTDLDSLFDVVSGGSGAGEVGFITSSGQDLGNRYPAGSLGITTGFCDAAGTDIGYLRTKKAAPKMTGYSATRQVYSSGTNTVSASRYFKETSGCATHPMCCVSHPTFARPGAFASGIITVKGICSGFNWGEVGWRVKVYINGCAITLGMGTSVPIEGTPTADIFGTAWSKSQDADLLANYRAINYEFDTNWSTERERTMQFSYGAYVSVGHYSKEYCITTKDTYNICWHCKDTISTLSLPNIKVSQMFYNSVGDTGWYDTYVSLA